jgi:hypothetical protein
MDNYNFFDNPPNLCSQKKTKMNEVFQIMDDKYNSDKYPIFDKNLYGKISLIIGRKQVGKTQLAKELTFNLIDKMSDSNIITDYNRLIILTLHQSKYYNEIEDMIDPNKTNFQIINYFTQLSDKIKDTNEDFSNSLVIIEEDINLDEKNKDSHELKDFFDYAGHKQMTIIIIRNNITSLPNIVSSIIDSLFIFSGAIYADLQKIHSRFLPEIGFGNFYHIYREIMNSNDNSICVINLIIPYRIKKEYKKKWNVLDSFYRYYLKEEISDNSSNDECQNELQSEFQNNLNNLLTVNSESEKPSGRCSIGIKRSWRNNSKRKLNYSKTYNINPSDEGTSYLNFQPIDSSDSSDNDNIDMNDKLYNIKNKDEIKDQIRIKLNQINDLVNDIKNLIRI